MRTAIHASLRQSLRGLLHKRLHTRLRKNLWATLGFLRDWRREAAKTYRHQYGIFAAVPVIWGCLDAFLWPWIATAGFLATAWFLEGRPGKRLAWQALLFSAWCLWLGFAWPESGLRNTSLSHGASGQYRDGAIVLTGKIDGTPVLAPHCSFTLSTRQGLVKVMADPPDFPLESGQTLSLSAHPAPPLPPTNPGQFDYPAYLLSLGIRAVYRAEEVRLLQRPPWPARFINRAHAALDTALARSVPAAQAPLLRACLLGSTDGLDPQLVEDFKMSGMLHILAISGQHIGLLALILLQVFSLLRLPRKAAFLVTAILIALYVPICGGCVSVLRSALMFWCVLPGILWERPGLALNNLGWAAAISLVWMPYQILSLGFQLSYAATYFLILYARPMANLLKRLRVRSSIGTYIVSTLALSLVLYLAVYPVLASGIHAAAPSSLIGNLATIGLSSGMLVASCLTLLGYPACRPAPWIPSGFGETAGAFSAGLSASVHALAHGPGASQSICALPWAWGLFLLFLLLAFPCASRTGRGRMLVLLGIFAFTGKWAYAQGRLLVKDPASVTYMDVGQGDGALLHLPGADILVDAGPIEAGRNVILPYLRYLGINRLDLVIITHPDLDHYGGLAYIAEHVEIGRVVYPGIEADTHAWNDLHAVLAKRGVPMTAVHRGQQLYHYPGIDFSVLSPGFADQFPERNDNSVATYLEMRGRRFLFTGDMEAPGQGFLLSHAYPKLEGVILKVPHHGSDRSNPPAFLQTIHPGIAILSAGRKNRFGHPGPATVEALRNLGSHIFLTARQGAVFFDADRSGGFWSTYLPRAYDAPAF